MCEEYGNVEKKLNLHYTYYNSQSSVNKTLFATIHCSGAHINILLQFVCLSINFLTLFLNVWTCLQTEPAFYIYGSSIESYFWAVKLNIIISTSKAFQCFTFMFVMSKKESRSFPIVGLFWRHYTLKTAGKSHTTFSHATFRKTSLLFLSDRWQMVGWWHF